MAGLLLVTTDLARRFGALRGRRAPAGTRPPWGEGLVELSLATRLNVALWEDIGTDELVWLDPSLAGKRDVARVRVLAGLLKDAIARVAASAEVIAGETAGDALAARHCVVRVLERHLAELPVVEPGEARLPSETDIADGLVVSMFACLNAAYLEPALASLHELLACGAWLGQLLRGRDAWLPRDLAACLGEALAVPAPGCSATRLVHAAADAACGVSRLRSAAQWTHAVGNPILVRARRAARARPIRLPVWNEPLHRRLTRVLEAAMPAPTPSRGATRPPDA